jgi:hypothetical protein
MVQNREILKKVICIITIAMLIVFPNIILASQTDQRAYTLQLGVFEQSATLESFKEKLEDKNIEYEIRAIEDKNYVYTGIYKTYNEAYKAYSNLKDIGINGYIRRLDIGKNNEMIKEDSLIQDRIVDEMLDEAITENQEDIEKGKNEKKTEGKTTETDKMEAKKVNYDDLNIAGSDRNSINVKNIIIEDDMVFEGVLGEQIVFFTVNKNWDINDNSYAYIRFGHSIPETYFGSTLTISINGVPVKTIFMKQTYEDIEDVKVKIPSNYFREGINELKIKSYHRITQFQCDDDSNPGNWVVVFKNSYLHLEYGHKADGVSLKEYPYPYLVEGADDPVQAMIQIPQNYNETTLKTALLLSADLGHRLPFENVEPDLKLYDANNLENENLIYIGRKTNLPKEYREKLTLEELDKLNNEVLIKEIEHPRNKDKRIMMILGESEEKMLMAVRSLFEDDLQLQNDSSVVWINDKTFVDENKDDEDEYLTFKELGYAPITLSGERFNSVKYDYRMPGNWQIKDGAQLYLRLRYADVINYDTSSVTVKMNGVPVFSKKLVKEGHRLDDFFVDIPDEIKNADTLSIEVSFTLDVPRDCASGSFDQNTWAFVSNDSYLYLPHEDRDKFDLENYPYPLIKDGELNNLKVLHDRGKFLNELSHAFGYIGHRLRNISNIEIIEEVPEKLDAGQYIYIGGASKDGFVSVFNDVIKLGYDENYETYRREHSNWVNVDNDSLGILQLTRGENYNIVSLTGLSEKPLKNASKYLSDFGFVGRLGGDVQVLYASGQNQIVHRTVEQNVIQDVKDRGDINTEALNRLSGSEIRQFLIFLGLLIFGSAIVVVLKKR